ncbi:class I SAM-dependent methyltransferase [Alteromonas sp. CYL-A6]|uniref:class I SAM-dependent methyltransferase n=1 Tax=Alteromonas nitratireducens TaxID=3390813 RepID=UPI0034AB2FED
MFNLRQIVAALTCIVTLQAGAQETLLDYADRSEQDKARDVAEHPLDIVAFSGVQPGMTVIDVFGGGGYFSEVFAKAVGPNGHVELINNPPYDRYAQKGLAARQMATRLPNVAYRVTSPDDMELTPDSADVALLMMTYHDLFYSDPENNWPAIDTDGFIAQIASALKPGGVLIVSDHKSAAGRKDKDSQSLHRIDAAFAKQQLLRSGLRFDGEIGVQSNPTDDHTLSVFDPAIRGQTDRFVMRFVKPAAR